MSSFRIFKMPFIKRLIMAVGLVLIIFYTIQINLMFEAT